MKLMKPMKSGIACVSLLAAAALAACSLAPDYRVPATPSVAVYESADPAGEAAAENGSWSPAQPGDGAARGAWWTNFGDPALDALEDRARSANQELAGAEARYRQARAAADAAGSNLFPILDLTASGVRERFSQNAPTNRSRVAGVSGDYVLRAQTSYELDFWGRVRNTIAAAKSRAQAGAADLESARLSIETELASDYFELRGLDAQLDLLRSTVDAYREALRITGNRYQGGAAAIVDVDQAQTQLATAEVQLAQTELSRRQLQHALAILAGAPPEGFALEATALNAQAPAITPGLPSRLLQRRPDVASAERQVFAANAEIGVARAAWFPTFTLDAGFGFESARTGNWIEAPSRLWSVGPSMLLTVFDAGLRRAQNQQAIAAYDETVASYRQTVLSAYGEVEDQLAASRWLDTQLEAQQRAVAGSVRALEQSNYRYKGGIATYLEVVTAQNAALEAQQAELNLKVRRLDAAVQLVKALGGDFAGVSAPPPGATAAAAPAP